ncbi:hypothetical protein CQ062_13585 [Ochrobactrum sp. MYb68]|nr:hypothetical protein CQ062_13585 [Ochrobactrum sp. MYb68]
MNRIVMELDEQGIFSFTSDEPVEIFVVCEHVPKDRVYQSRVDVSVKTVDNLLADSPVGHYDDDTEGKRPPSERKQRTFQ